MKKLFVVFFSAVLFTALTITADALPRTSWAVDYADFVYNNGILDGSVSSLSSTAKITRGKFVLAVSRIEEISVNNNVSTGFSDVPSGSQYAGAVKWAAENGLVGGYGDGTFGVGDYMTKQDAAVLVYRYLVTYKGITLPTTYAAPGYGDYGSISNYAITAVVALHRAGIISGNDEGNFLPLNQIKTTEACVLFTHSHGFRHNTSSNSITVYVKDSGGNATSNAAVFIYDSAGGYPGNLVQYTTDSEGFVTIPSLLSYKQYAINVFGYYTGTFTPGYVKTSKMYVIMSMPQNKYDFDLSASYNRSLLWPHSGCGHGSWYYPSWCPLSYARSSQNFGWRYLNGNCEFHQGMDYGTYGYNEEVRNTFGVDVSVIVQGWNEYCGNYVQVEYDGKYVTYQHLKDRTTHGGEISAGGLIGYTGQTGDSYGIHMHVTVCQKERSLYCGNNGSVYSDFFDPRVLFK